MMMLHRMSMERGWSHEKMMMMPKHIFYRYYGYWYQDKLREQDEMDRLDRERKMKESQGRPKQWK